MTNLNAYDMLRDSYNDLLGRYVKLGTDYEEMLVERVPKAQFEEIRKHYLAAVQERDDWHTMLTKAKADYRAMTKSRDELAARLESARKGAAYDAMHDTTVSRQSYDALLGLYQQACAERDGEAARAEELQAELDRRDRRQASVLQTADELDGMASELVAMAVEMRQAGEELLSTAGKMFEEWSE